MSLTGEDTLLIQDKEEKSERVDKVEEGIWRSISDSVIIDYLETKEYLPDEKNHMVRMA